MYDSIDTINDIVLSRFSEEVDKDEIRQPQVLYHEAIQALKPLQLYKEQQEKGET